MLTGAQLRAARALLNISAQQLADRTKLGVATIRRAEGSDGMVTVTAANLHQLIRHLEESGVVLLAPGELGEGVCFRSSRISAALADPAGQSR